MIESIQEKNLGQFLHQLDPDENKIARKLEDKNKTIRKRRFHGFLTKFYKAKRKGSQNKSIMNPEKGFSGSLPIPRDIYICKIILYISKLAMCSWEQPEDFLFNHYYTEV